MSRETGIEWTDATWNPIRGCSRVSEGCRHCYAETVANRFCGPGSPYEGVVRIGADGKGTGQWNGEIKFVEERLLDPLRWKALHAADGKARSRRIFVNSMSDLFHEGVTDEMLDRIFAVMALCPQHTFQVLTKRPERMRAYLAADWHRRVAERVYTIIHEARHNWTDNVLDRALLRAKTASFDLKRADDGIPVEGRSLGIALRNVWLGVSVERQQEADERIPLLLQTPAAVRFLSVEPLLGPVDLRSIPCDLPTEVAGGCYDALDGNWWPALGDYEVEWRGRRTELPHLDWVIVGGESGPGARPMHPDWARSLRDQCKAAGVPFFFKQWGEWESFSTARIHELTARHPKLSMSAPTCLVKADGRVVRPYCMNDAPGVEMVRVGKKAAGHLLDGEVIQQFPEVRA